MPTSTITSKGQTTVPKEVRDTLDVGPGDRLTWEVRGGKVAITTERPGLFRWEASLGVTPSIFLRTNRGDHAWKRTRSTTG